MNRRTTSRFSVVVLAGVSVVLASGCGSAPRFDRLGLALHRPVTRQEVRRLPDAALLYPGSRVVRAIGSDERKQPGEPEPDPAFAGNVAVARATVAALLEWYDRRLTSRGYRPATYYPLAGQPTGRAWTAPGNKEQIQVGLYAQSGSPAGLIPRGYVGYESVLVNYRVTGPPPA